MTKNGGKQEETKRKRNEAKKPKEWRRGEEDVNMWQIGFCFCFPKLFSKTKT